MAMPPDRPVLCVSPLAPGAGLDSLFTAVGLLSDDRPHLRLEVIGDGPLEPVLRRQVRALGLDDIIRFRGRLSPAAVRVALGECAMLVLPRREDAVWGHGGPPAVVLQAMACGTPVVSADLIGPSDAVRRDTTGLHVPPDRPTTLAAAMASLLDDPSRAAEVGAAGRRLVAGLRDQHQTGAPDRGRHQVGG